MAFCSLALWEKPLAAAPAICSYPRQMRREGAVGAGRGADGPPNHLRLSSASVAPRLWSRYFVGVRGAWLANMWTSQHER